MIFLAFFPLIFISPKGVVKSICIPLCSVVGYWTEARSSSCLFPALGERLGLAPRPGCFLHRQGATPAGRGTETRSRIQGWRECTRSENIIYIPVLRLQVLYTYFFDSRANVYSYHWPNCKNFYFDLRKKWMNSKHRRMIQCFSAEYGWVVGKGVVDYQPPWKADHGHVEHWRFGRQEPAKENQSGVQVIVLIPKLFAVFWDPHVKNVDPDS